jgi:hypothetical protein
MILPLFSSLLAFIRADRSNPIPPTPEQEARQRNDCRAIGRARRYRSASVHLALWRASRSHPSRRARHAVTGAGGAGGGA